MKRSAFSRSRRGIADSRSQTSWMLLLQQLVHIVFGCCLAAAARVLRLRWKGSGQPQAAKLNATKGEHAGGCGKAAAGIKMPAPSSPLRGLSAATPAGVSQITHPDAAVQSAVMVRAAADGGANPLDKAASAAGERCAGAAGAEPLIDGDSGYLRARGVAAGAAGTAAPPSVPSGVGGGGGIVNTSAGAAASPSTGGVTPVAWIAPTEMLPYMPILRLVVNRFQLRRVLPEDATDGYDERLRLEMERRTGRYLVGAYVRGGRGWGCEVLLDSVEAVTATVGASGGACRATAGGVVASSVGRGTFGWADAIATYERRRATAGASGASSYWLSLARRLGMVPAAQDAQLTAAEVRAALLQRPMWSPRSWAWWARPLITALCPRRWSKAGGACCPAPVGAPTATAGTAAAAACAARESPVGPRCIVASRLLAAAPRVLQVGPRATGARTQLPAPAPSKEHPPGGQPAPGVRLQVALSICCDESDPFAAGGVSLEPPGSHHVHSGGDADHSFCAGHSGYWGRPHPGATGGPGPSGADSCAEVLLRHEHQYVGALVAPAAAPAAGPALPHKPCRRYSCSRHLMLYRDVSVPYDSRTHGTGGGVAPGLLLLEPWAPASRSTGQRPVPVLLLDELSVTEELQRVLADKCCAAGCGVAKHDDLLVDLGVFVQQLTQLRASAAPAMELAATGIWRHEWQQSYCCKSAGRSRCCGGAGISTGGACSRAGVGTAQHGSHGCAEATSPDGEAGVPSDAALGAATAPAAGSGAPDPACPACALRRMWEVRQRLLSTAGLLSLGEHLLHHATASGWTRTAAYIASCLTDLLQVDVLAGAMSGHRGAARASRCSGGGGDGGGGGTLPMSPRRRRGRRLIRIGGAVGQPSAFSAARASGVRSLYGKYDLEGLVARLFDVDKDCGAVVSMALVIPVLAGLLLRLGLWLAAQSGNTLAEQLQGAPLMAMATLMGFAAGVAARVCAKTCDASTPGRTAFPGRPSS